MRITAILLVLAPASSAQFLPEPLILEGDSVPSVGLVTSVNNLAVNDSGTWIVEVDTDGPVDDDSALIANGVLYLQEGMPILDTEISSFDTVNLNNSGFSGWNLFLEGPTSDLDSGVFGQPGGLLIRESDVSAAPEFGVGTTYVGFLECKVTHAGDVLVMASVDDPDVPTGVDRALVWLDIDQGAGTVTESVVVAEGDVLPGQTEAVADLENGPHNFDANDAGDVIFIADLTGDASVDHAVYVNSTLIAQEGSIESGTGRAWLTLASAECALNASGDWVLSGTLAGDTDSNLVIVSSAGVVAQESDSLAAIAPHRLTSFGSGPVLLDDGGDVLWYGDWDDPDTDVDTGLFLNDELIVQEGVTMVGDRVIDTLRGIQDGYTMSDSGRFIVFEAILDDGTEGAFRIDRGGAALAMPGCSGNPGGLAQSGGTTQLGGTLELLLDGGPAGSSAAALFFAASPVAGWPECGVDVPGFGEILISFTPPNPLVTVIGGGGSSVPFSLPLPADPSLVGVHLFTQGLFVEPVDQFTMSTGLELILGELL